MDQKGEREFIGVLSGMCVCCVLMSLLPARAYHMIGKYLLQQLLQAFFQACVSNLTASCYAPDIFFLTLCNN